MFMAETTPSAMTAITATSTVNGFLTLNFSIIITPNPGPAFYCRLSAFLSLRTCSMLSITAFHNRSISERSVSDIRESTSFQ